MIPPKYGTHWGGSCGGSAGSAHPTWAAPTRASSSVRFAVEALHPPPARQAVWGRPSSSSRAPWGAARSQRQLGTRPPRTPLTAALRPQPPSLRLSSPLLPLRIPPPPSPAVSPRHSPVPLPLRAAASHPLCHALSSPSPPNPLRTDAVGSKLNFSITAHLSYPGA